MKSPDSNHPIGGGLLAVPMMAVASTARSADAPVTLKDTFKECFLVGAAVNRSMVTGRPGLRRSAEQSTKDVAPLKEHFNQITAENDTKWQLIHPRAGQAALV